MVLQPVEIRVDSGALVAIAERECERLCTLIDTAKSPSERERALKELKGLARDVLDCIRALDPAAARELAEEELADLDELETAA